MKALRSVVIAGLLVAALCGAPLNASAQTVFVEGGPLLDYDPTLRSQTTTTAGLTAGAGLFLTPRFSVRLEFEFPRWHASDYSGRGRVANHIEAYSTHEENRARSGSVLFGYHLRPATRVSVALLAGGTSATRAWRNRGFTQRLALDGSLIEHHDFENGGDNYDWLAVSFGADAAIAVTKHLAVVPQLRLHSYLYSEHTSLMFSRPRISVRWQF
jgi:hypothetical protein